MNTHSRVFYTQADSDLFPEEVQTYSLRSLLRCGSLSLECIETGIGTAERENTIKTNSFT